jgi:putative resolvase
VKLAEWARRNGVHPQTAYRWFREGTMPVPARRLPSGTIMVEVADAARQGQVVVYARVSSADQRADLDRQVARVTAWVTGGGPGSFAGGNRGRIRAERAAQEVSLAAA